MGWGGRFKREGIYVHLWLTHVGIWQKTTQYCKAITLQLKKIKKTTVYYTDRKKYVYNLGQSHQIFYPFGHLMEQMVFYITRENFRSFGSVEVGQGIK